MNALEMLRARREALDAAKARVGDAPPPWFRVTWMVVAMIVLAVACCVAGAVVAYRGDLWMALRNVGLGIMQLGFAASFAANAAARYDRRRYDAVIAEELAARGLQS